MQAKQAHTSVFQVQDQMHHPGSSHTCSLDSLTFALDDQWQVGAMPKEPANAHGLQAGAAAPVLAGMIFDVGEGEKLNVAIATCGAAPAEIRPSFLPTTRDRRSLSLDGTDTDFLAMDGKPTKPLAGADWTSWSPDKMVRRASNTAPPRTPTP